MSQAPSDIPQRRIYTVQEYFALEKDADTKHEFIDGQIIAMAGGTFPHARITANVVIAIGKRLAGKPCHVLSSDANIRYGKRNGFGYADAVVVCGKEESAPIDVKPFTPLTNPKVLIEVLSPSTASYDRGEKFSFYREIDSLSEYVIVWQDQPRVEVCRRNPDGSWFFDNYEGIDLVAKLPSLELEIPLTEIFAGIEFPPAAPV
jgi:Uma2 family endonuclease